MKRLLTYTLVALVVSTQWSGEAAGRGFGGFRGGFSGGFSTSRSGGFGGSFSGSRSFSGYSGWRSGSATGSYDRSWSGSHGGSINTEGTRSAAYGPGGGFAAGGTRETTATGPEGRAYSGSRTAGAAVGPYGRTVGGAEHYGTASGPRGTVSGGWQSAFAGRTFPTDVGLAHYSALGVAGVGHSTAYWSRGYVTKRAGAVRTGFGYYSAFHPAWYTAHPGAWAAAGWAASAAWTAPTWPAVDSFCGFAGEPPYTYDYGNNIVYQDSNVYVGGQDAGTAQAYAQQATTLAERGQAANAPTTEEWKPLGIFALAQGDETKSNNIFQLAVNKDGIIRGNYYDGMMDTTTEVFGSVDKTVQRAAWTIGKKKDRVFETGLYNLTQSEAPVLVHLGADRTQQMLLVRVEQPKGAH